MATKRKAVALKAEDLLLDPRCQVRVGGIDLDHTEQITERLKAGKKVKDPVEVTEVDSPGEKPLYYVTDGFERVTAHKRAERVTVPCVVTKGTLEEAILRAAQSNQAHLGRPLTSKDKRRSVEMYLGVKPNASARMVAGHLQVGDDLVLEVKKELRAAGKLKDGPVEGKDKKKHAAVKSRDAKVDELGLDLADFEWAALKSRSVETAGQLRDYLDQGGNFGWSGKKYANFVQKVKRLGIPHAPQQPREAGGKKAQGRELGPAAACRQWQGCYGALVRSYDLVKTHIREDDRKKIDQLLDELGRASQEWAGRIEAEAQEPTAA